MSNRLNNTIYLDYMATTPIDPHVIERMLHFMGPDAQFGNPASLQHAYGLHAAEAVEHAREQLATTLGTTPEAFVFTSGATEANNLAILGAAQFYHRKGRHLITMSTEHKSVLDTFQHLEKQGYDVTYLNPKPDGLLDLEQLIHAIRSDTVLASIMHVNNEIGVIQDIHAIGNILRTEGIIYHVDASQSAGKIPINLQSVPVDLMSLSAHKNYGPKGIGALYVRQKPRLRIQAQSYGGGQEHGLRSGTLATHQIVGMGEAFALSNQLLSSEQARILGLRERLWQRIQSIPGIQMNGSPSNRIAGNLNISFSGIDGTELLSAVHPLAVSTTSACVASSVQPSYVLQAIGLSPDRAKSSIRISIGRFTTENDIETAITVLNNIKRTKPNVPAGD